MGRQMVEEHTIWCGTFGGPILECWGGGGGVRATFNEVGGCGALPHPPTLIPSRVWNVIPQNLASFGVAGTERNVSSTIFNFQVWKTWVPKIVTILKGWGFGPTPFPPAYRKGGDG